MTRKVVETCIVELYVVGEIGWLQRLDVFAAFSKYKYQWQAKGIGSNGSFHAGASSVFRSGAVPISYVGRDGKVMGPKRYEEYTSARDELISYLLNEGWEPQEMNYHKSTFTRVVWV